MSKKFTDAERQQRADDERAVREIESSHLKPRQATWQSEHETYAKTEGGRLYAEWLSSVKARFVAAASTQYAAAHPPWTFERVADQLLARPPASSNGATVIPSVPDPAYRAEVVARLARVHAERNADANRDHNPHAPDPSHGGVVWTTTRKSA